mmetsp:Transcript_50533/g.149020  ORF Transcript_50533/g.149020 Transcript_50533/m.149020 type:complete len:114 (-) Transcript_50533:3-344(-)
MDETLEVGRQHQHSFFDKLLQADPYWLTFISRSHCRVTLTTVQAAGAPAPQLRLKVENLSTNPIFVCGRPLTKGNADALGEGGTLAWIAKGKDDKETTFIELRLRRARGQFSR